ncbi:MAG: hypothetical protein QXJ02_02050, partial [Candidatus Bathyarchaeia archaeon]
ILYIKSEKISIVEYVEGIPGHPCTGAYRATQTVHSYKPQDREANDLLEESGVAYKLVDLCNCSFLMQLKAKLDGVNETPTLVFKGKKIKGLEQIKQALREVKT